MELVSFVSVEDIPPDLILSFAIWQPEWEDVKSVILMRIPRYEPLLDESERGVKVSDEDWLDDEVEMLQKIEFSDNFVRIFTANHQIELDLRKVEMEEIEQARIILEKMNFDNCFELSW